MTSMRIYLFAAAAAAALAAPALAAENGPYVGVEGGALFSQEHKMDVTLNNSTEFDNGYRVKDKTGYDVDLIAGYKLGLLRLEAEGGYKRASLKDLKVSQPLLTAVGAAAGVPVTADKFNLDGHVGITSLMVNALADANFGSSRFGGYVGGGVGSAWANLSNENDNALAAQAIVGLRASLTDHLDAGVKYRYFHTGKLTFDNDFAVNGVSFSSRAKDNFNSSSVLASLVYNFGSHATPVAEEVTTVVAVPEAPPEQPATQTCADGSLIAVTAACAEPSPPSPPPPPMPQPERG
jgi:opacity protein-like surface antigen